MSDPKLFPEFWRIYTREDGKSAMERVELALSSRNNGGVHSEIFETKNVRVVYQPPGHLNPWHTTSQRQLVVTLAGESELETGDGQVLVARPGVVEIVEDTVGEGHVTRSRGEDGRLVLFIPLAEGVEIE